MFSAGCIFHFLFLASALLTKLSELPVSISASARCPLTRTLMIALDRLLGAAAVTLLWGQRAAEVGLFPLRVDLQTLA